MLSPALVGALVLTTSGQAAAQVPTPQDHFGFDVGTPGQLATWDALTSYSVMQTIY